MIAGERLAAATTAAVRAVRERVSAFVASPTQDWRALAVDYDALTYPLDGVEGAARLLPAVHPQETVRLAAEDAEREIAALRTELALSRPVFERLRAVEAAARDRAGVDPLAARVIARALRDFRRTGVDRDESTRTRIAELRNEAVVLTQEFDRTVAADTRWIEIPEAEAPAAMRGLPADFVRAHPADAAGTVRVSTDPQDYIPYMAFAESERHRRALHTVRFQRGLPGNLELLRGLLVVRREIARLLGHATWAEYELADKMAGSPRAARELIERTAHSAAAGCARELAELSAAKVAAGGTAELGGWDRFYLIDRLRRQRFDVDAREVREFFPFAATRDGLFALVEELFDVRIRRYVDPSAWHASVESYELSVADGPIGRFHLDVLPRAGKYKHAALFELCSGIGGEDLPEAAIVCNYPSGVDGTPALLQHEQVTTFFHEFGHLLHHLFGGKQRFLAQSAMATEIDFVEVPSQLFEEWAWSHDVLARFARRADGSVIPRPLVERMRAAEDWGKSVNVRAQTFYGLLALEVHERDPRSLDFEALERELRAAWGPFAHEEGTSFCASFGHLTGYGSAYYAYLWALVIAKDLWGSFEREGLFDRATAARLRGEILAPGATKDAAELVQGFLGRPYDEAAFAAYLAR